VLDAVKYARANASVDDRRIYMVGASGGGHMTLMMAARAPRLWAAASAWVPIADLAAWHEQVKQAGRTKYYQMIRRCCGGAPRASAAVDEQYRKRSPLRRLGRAAGLAIDINTGIRDGHQGSVPIEQSLRAFNVLARVNRQPEKMLSREQIDTMTRAATVPPRLTKHKQDELHRQHKVLFRRTAGPARVTVFDGGHAIDVPTAFDWLASRRKRR